MLFPLENQSLSIVLLGKFNPAIFSPAWLSKVGSITRAEADGASVQVIHPELSQFSVDRFLFEVQKERFQMTTSMEPFVQLLDAVVNLFSDGLPHTPIDKLGINYDVHFRLDAPARRIALGRALAPVGPWGAFGQRLTASEDSHESVGGLQALVMQEIVKTGRPGGYRRVQIEPSRKFQSPLTVRMHINDHYALTNYADDEGALPMMELLGASFDSSQAEAKTIVTELMDYTGKLS